MNQRNLIISLILLLHASFAWSTEIVVTRGNLQQIISQLTASTANPLVLKGEIDITEANAFAKLPATIKQLDISNLEIYNGNERCDSLPGRCFFASTLTEIALPSTLRALGEGTFAHSALHSIKLPQRITTLPEYCFYGASAFSDIDGIANITEVGNYALCNTAIRSLNLAKAQLIGDFACAMISSLEELLISENTTIGIAAFAGNSELSSYIASSIGAPLQLFASGNTKLELSINEDTVAEGAYAGSDASSVRFGANVNRINSAALASMTKLKQINVSSLGDRIPTTASDAFINTDAPSITLHIAAGKSAVWKADPIWGKFFIPEASNVDIDKNNSISVRREGNDILITAPIPMERIEMYTLSGVVLKQLSDCGTSIRIETITSEPVIISIRAGELKSITKLR